MISQKVDKRRSDSSMAPREIIYQRVLADLMLNALLDSKEPSSAKDFGERRPKPLAYQKALRAARQTNPLSSACSGLPTLIDASHMRRSPRGARVERRPRLAQVPQAACGPPVGEGGARGLSSKRCGWGRREGPERRHGGHEHGLARRCWSTLVAGVGMRDGGWSGDVRLLEAPLRIELWGAMFWGAGETAEEADGQAAGTVAGRSGACLTGQRWRGALLGEVERMARSCVVETEEEEEWTSQLQLRWQGREKRNGTEAMRGGLATRWWQYWRSDVKQGERTTPPAASRCPPQGLHSLHKRSGVPATTRPPATSNTTPIVSRQFPAQLALCQLEPKSTNVVAPSSNVWPCDSLQKFKDVNFVISINQNQLKAHHPQTTRPVWPPVPELCPRAKDRRGLPETV
ncbi:hypothetical protein IWX90DRAFT_480513 [Phyllosticta citrichinensis]|uniref:Uncharacterized protein n=1 Tax=Phyllosticta citrichinensis TaxID=1130410 RepID=A0ABR1XJ67_9PEZI